MRSAPRRWEIAATDPVGSWPPIMGRILSARGYDEVGAREFLEPAPAHPDPHGLAGMAAAVATLAAATRAGDRIAIYGDYDADGVTACALLTRSLRAAGHDVVPYIPNRMTEGYGLHAAALEELAAGGVRCVVTVDCGTSSVEVAAHRPDGMRLVITDHHLPLAPAGHPPALAPADALINPKQPECTYPFDGLAGAGVAWKLLGALEAEGIVPAGSAASEVGLAALGTVADMMPLRGENRALVRRGLEALSGGSNLGISTLGRSAGVGLPLAAADLAFMIAPRLNAAGRMEDARLALELCLADDGETARRLAGRLNEQNVVRQAAVATALAAAEERVAAIDEDAPAIVLGDPDWPMGIVGLVAGRLAERYARPTFIACLDPAEAKGSARSAGGVHIVTALDGAASTLLRYGGHAAAAGFSLEAGRFDEFAAAISASVAGQVGNARPERVFKVDAEILTGELTVDLARVLTAIEPCGQGNPSPLLALQGVQVLGTSTFGSDRQHIRVVLGGAGGMAEAIAFNKPGLAAHLPRGRLVDACFGLEIDIWEGCERLRCRLRDIRPARPIAPPAAPPAGLTPAAAG